MEPVSAGVALLGLLANLNGQSNASDTANANLQFQREQAQEQQRLATATRTDSYGNSETYDPATNSWTTTLSPMQKAIQDAMQSENYQSLTTDAARNRSARKQAYNNSMEAQQPLREALAGYRYDQPASEAADRNTLETLMLQANQQKDLGNRAILQREALRMDKGATIPALIKSTDDKVGSDLASTILQARQQATGQRQQAVASHNAQYTPQIQTLEGIVQNNGANAPIANPNTASMLNAIQGQMAQGANSAMASGAGNINTAAGALTTAQGKQINVDSLVKALSANNKTAKATTDNPTNVGSATSVDNTGAWDSDIPWGKIPDYLDNVNFNF